MDKKNDVIYIVHSLPRSTFDYLYKLVISFQSLIAWLFTVHLLG